MTAPAIVLCPGQGAQAVGMGKAWYDASADARQIFDQADQAMGLRLGMPLSQLCFEGPAEKLNRTDVSQPAIFVASLASWKAVLAARSMGNGEQPLAAAAGLSLGEYSALVVAGAMSLETGLELVSLRGRAMQEAAESDYAASGGGGGMIALVGATDEQAEEIAAKARGAHVLVTANFNAPGQVVLSGHKAAVADAAKVAEGMGIRSQILAVAGAFHSPLMQPAADKLAAALDRAEIRAPRCPVVSNVTAKPHEADPATIRRRLVEQLTSPVRWAASCRWLASNASGDYLELCPGRTLMGLMRRIDKEIKVATHDTP